MAGGDYRDPTPVVRYSDSDYTRQLFSAYFVTGGKKERESIYPAGLVSQLSNSQLTIVTCSLPIANPPVTDPFVTKASVAAALISVTRLDPVVPGGLVAVRTGIKQSSTI
jgi:hypothetical protein